jgi:hypothetical protein
MNGDKMNPLDIIYQNFTYCAEWRDDSFLGILHEERRLDMDAYWKLEWALHMLTMNKLDYPRHLIWPVFRIYSYGNRLFQADIDPDDGFKIHNFDSERSRDFTERFQMVFEGFFRGEQHDLKLAFDERNPLLE